MSLHLNKPAYAKLVEGDMAWLRNQKKCPEQQHLLAIARESVEAFYPTAKE